MVSGKSFFGWGLGLIIVLAACALLFWLIFGFTGWARTLGGTITRELPSGQKVVNVTWKDDNLWILTRASRPGEVPETLTFTEHSKRGLIQGQVIVKEQSSK